MVDSIAATTYYNRAIVKEAAFHMRGIFKALTKCSTGLSLLAKRSVISSVTLVHNRKKYPFTDRIPDTLNFVRLLGK